MLALALLARPPCNVRAKGSGKGSPRREGRLLTELSCLDKHCVPQEQRGGQPEAGAVHWTTSFAQAEVEARASGKLIFVQFTEIPGSQTCQDYGRDVLSHPIIADLLEEAFVPCLVNTHGGGEAAEILGIFGIAELSGGPAVHFVDADRREVAPRYQCKAAHGNSNLRAEAAAVFHAAADALAAVQQPLPPYARLMGPVGAAAVVGLGMESEWLVFTVDSFWSAEALLGALPAALSTAKEDEAVADFLQEQAQRDSEEKGEGKSATLNALLFRPVQRMCVYPLLFKQAMKEHEKLKLLEADLKRARHKPTTRAAVPRHRRTAYGQ